MANHLEKLVAEWLEFKGYLVRLNVKVGRRPKGGYEGELDVVAYHPINNHLRHIETSLDADKWAKKEERFKKKFDAGRKYIIEEIFTWLPHNKRFEQWAVLWGSDKNHDKIGGGKVVPIWKLYKQIADDVMMAGSPAGHAISEQWPLLRTMQYTLHWAMPERTGESGTETLVPAEDDNMSKAGQSVRKGAKT
jgi:hypothetical protein